MDSSNRKSGKLQKLGGGQKIFIFWGGVALCVGGQEIFILRGVALLGRGGVLGGG